MRRPPLVKHESDHNLVTADIRLLGRIAPNRRKRETKGRRAIDLQQLMANPELRGAFIERFAPLPLGTDVDGMVSTFADAILSIAENIAPRAKRRQGPNWWCASKEKKAETLAAGQKREAARKLMRTDPSNSNLRTPSPSKQLGNALST